MLPFRAVNFFPDWRMFIYNRHFPSLNLSGVIRAGAGAVSGIYYGKLGQMARYYLCLEKCRLSKFLQLMPKTPVKRLLYPYSYYSFQNSLIKKRSVEIKNKLSTNKTL